MEFTDSNSSSPRTASNPTTRKALQVPELLLRIFSYADKSDLVNLAIVCTHCTPSARSILYGDIDIGWQFKTAQPLLNAFGLNPELLDLVHSLRVTGFDPEDPKHGFVHAMILMDHSFDDDIISVYDEEETEQSRDSVKRLHLLSRHEG